MAFDNRGNLLVEHRNAPPWLWDLAGSGAPTSVGAAVARAAILPGERVVTIDKNGAIETHDGGPGGTQESGFKRAHTLALAARSEQVALGSRKRLAVVSTEDGHTVWERAGPVRALDWTADERHLVVGIGSDVLVLGGQSGQQRQRFRGHGARRFDDGDFEATDLVLDVASAPMGGRIASASTD